MELNFNRASDLLAFLTGHRYGRMILREAVFGGESEWLVNELLDQNRASYVLVKAYRDGLVEVYGERDVYAEIKLLGRSVTFPEHEIAQEKSVDRTLSPGHKSVHFPGMKRASALRGANFKG